MKEDPQQPKAGAGKINRSPLGGGSSQAVSAQKDELQELKQGWDQELIAHGATLDDMTQQELAYWKGVENTAKLSSDQKLQIQLRELKLEENLLQQKKEADDAAAKESQKQWDAELLSVCQTGIG